MRHPLLCLVLLLGPSVAADGAVRRVTVGMAVSVAVRVAVRVTVDLCLCNKVQIHISRLSHFLQYSGSLTGRGGSEPGGAGVLHLGHVAVVEELAEEHKVAGVHQ